MATESSMRESVLYMHLRILFSAFVFCSLPIKRNAFDFFDKV